MTGAYNCRLVRNSNMPSLHAYGAAVDVNPQQNPYLYFDDKNGEMKLKLIPQDGYRHINRMKYRINKAQPYGLSEEIVDVFADNGFIYWGGYWNNPIDYMHFEIWRQNSLLLLNMTKTDALKYFS